MDEHDRFWLEQESDRDLFLPADHPTDALQLAKIKLRNAEERHARLMERLLQLHYIEFERFQKLHAQHTDRRSLPRPKTGHFDIVNGFKFVEEQEVTIQEILGTTNNKDGEELRPADTANEHRASYIEYKERNQEIFNMTVDKMCLKFDERLLKTRLQCMEEIVNIKKEIKDEEKSLQSKTTDIPASSLSAFFPSAPGFRVNSRDPRLRRQSPDVPGTQIQR